MSLYSTSIGSIRVVYHCAYLASRGRRVRATAVATLSCPSTLQHTRWCTAASRGRRVRATAVATLSCPPTLQHTRAMFNRSYLDD